MSREHVQGLMQEIGAVADLAAVAEHEGEDVWSLLVDDEEGGVVWVDLDDARGCLVLSGEVGTPQPVDRERLNDLLLRYNFHWDATGGVRMAVEGEGGPVIQLADVPLAGLDAGRLGVVVRGFAAMLAAWRAILRGGGVSGAAGPDELLRWPGMGPGPLVIRG